jgi:dihydrodipicolinate synthase/N-acetylneuraminate lyase
LELFEPAGHAISVTYNYSPEALARLVEDYEKAEMSCAAEALRRRLEWYREKNF